MTTGNDDIIFNLFYLIRQVENALLYTDDANYITAQSNYKAPLWIYICGTLSDETPLTELKTLVKESLTQNHPSSNTAYQKLGYVKAGEITEFTMIQK